MTLGGKSSLPPRGMLGSNRTPAPPGDSHPIGVSSFREDSQQSLGSGFAHRQGTSLWTSPGIAGTDLEHIRRLQGRAGPGAVSTRFLLIKSRGSAPPLSAVTDSANSAVL